MSQATDKVHAVLSAMQNKFGKESVMSLGDTPNQDIESYSTGSIGIDHATGVGGFPKGRITILKGPFSSSKTTLTMHGIADCQRKGGIAAFLDFENAFDKTYAEKLGIDTDNLIFSQPDSAEHGMQLALELAQTGHVDMIVVDSVAAMVPQAEINGEVGDAHMAVVARLMGQALRKMTPHIKTNNVAMIFINQIRANPGVTFGSKECVDPLTMVTIYDEKSLGAEPMTMKDLFQKAGMNYVDMIPGEWVDIDKESLFISSSNRVTGETEDALIRGIIRKEDSEIYEVRNLQGEELLQSSADHRVYDPTKGYYVRVGESDSIHVLSASGEVIPAFCFGTGVVGAVLDMEVEGNYNYFSNGILSHNTSPGGRALDFFASLILDVRIPGREVDKSTGEVIANKGKCTVKKNKMAPPFKVAEYLVKFNVGISKMDEMIDYGIKMGIVKQSGSWFSMKDEKIGQGRARVADYLTENQDVYDDLLEAVLEGLAKPKG